MPTGRVLVSFLVHISSKVPTQQMPYVVLCLLAIEIVQAVCVCVCGGGGGGGGEVWVNVSLY